MTEHCLKASQRPVQIDEAPSDCVFWLGKQLKDDGSVLFINSRARIRFARVRPTSCRVERLEVQQTR